MWAGTSILFLTYDQIYAQNFTRSGGKRFAYKWCYKTPGWWPNWCKQPQRSGKKRFANLFINLSITKSIHITSKIQPKGICYIKPMRKVVFCKKEVARTRLRHVLLQECSAWIDGAQLSEVTWIKVWNPEKVCKQLFSEEEDSGHVECRYRIIGRLISIEVLWESFHPNTPITGAL